jgi:hypothetical protein
MITYSLYVKTHRKTNLKYLGFTKHNPYKYKGSGIYWLSHLSKHGYDVDTEVLLETTNKQEIETYGIYYSSLWSVVESNDWANIKPETGAGGGVTGMNKGMKRPEFHRTAMKAGWERIKQNGYQPWNKGITGLKGPCKPIILVSPEGEEFLYESLKAGCKDKSLIYTKMSSVNSGKRTDYKGWTLKPVNTV